MKKEVYCEECKKPMFPPWRMYCRGCDRNICHNCGRFYFNIWDRTDGSYNSIVCSRCHKLLDKYRKRMDDMYESFNEEKEKLELEWQDECREGEKNEKNN